MYEKLRKRRKRNRWVEGIFSKNPVVVLGLALPFAIMITTNLKNAVALSIILCCTLIPTILLATLIGKYLPKWFASIVYTLFSMTLVIACSPLIQSISPETIDSLGIYIPLVAVNSIFPLLYERYSKENANPIMALADSVTYSLGFSFALCIIATVREFFGNSSLWGISLDLPIKMSGLQIAFSGFILTALFGALVRFIKRMMLCVIYKRSNRQAEETV